MTIAMQAVAIKPTGPKALRIGLFRDKKIVEERVIRQRETISIGTSEKNHLIIKSDALPPRFELFQLVGDDYILNFTTQMTGRVVMPAGVQRLEKLRETGAARNAGTHHQVKLSDSSRGNIKIGDLTVFFEFVVPPPITPRPQLPSTAQGGVVKSIDWMFTTFVVLSYMLFFGFIIYMENADWELDTSAAIVPENLARLIFEEPLPPPEEVEEEEVTEEAAEEPEEAPTPTKRERPSQAAEAAPDPAKSSEARARIAQEAAAQAEAMLLGALGEGGALGDVLAGGAVTGNQAEVLAQAAGVGVATRGASGTLRTRSGGGGSGQQAGLGSLKAGKGAGSSAKEGGALKERAVRGNVGLRGGGDVGGSGDFDSALVVKQIKRRLRAITRCYESELRKNPTLAGKITVQFTIQERGNVTDAKVVENTMKSPAVGSCITAAVGRFRFNPGPDGGSVTFKYPFVFQPQG